MFGSDPEGIGKPYVESVYSFSDLPLTPPHLMGQTGVVKQHNLSFCLISHIECIKRYWETICKSLYR